MSMIGCTKFRFTGRPRELCWPSVETDVFEMQGLVVDAAERRRNPVRKLSRLGHPAAHQRLHEGVVLRTWQPFEFMLFPRLFGQCFAFGADEQAGKVSNFAMKAFVRQGQAEGNAGLIDHSLPAADAVGNLVDVEIGRASCRERGEMWVGAGCVK